MATTYELIASNTLGSSSATVSFTSIPQTFDDLIIVATCRSDAGGSGHDSLKLAFNSSTANFSARYLQGNGASAYSGTYARYAGVSCLAANTADTFSSVEIIIPNYAGSTNKSYSSSSVQETNATTAHIAAIAGLWSDTSAITDIELSLEYGDYLSGSSFFLYGITKA